MFAQRKALVSPTEYLESEKTATVKHEYVDGQVYAMAGVSRRHNEIALNIATACRAAARRKGGCATYMADVKVHVAARNSYYYPDVVVSCAAEGHSHLVERPCLIVEVLSPQTEAIDRREKRVAYQSIASLREYVLVEQSQAAVLVCRRDGDGWIEETLEAGDSMRLDCLDLDLPLADIYDGVAFD